MSVFRHTLWLVVILIFGLMITGGSSQGIFALGVFANCSEVFMPCFVGSDMTSSCPEPCLCLTDYNNDRVRGPGHCVKLR
uniref:8 kDa Amblyomma family member n=1 Tax=Rhipicephalus zambeziensis TaxID=60191 RepID=A0A224YA58_9ACAR